MPKSDFDTKAGVYSDGTSDDDELEPFQAPAVDPSDPHEIAELGRIIELNKQVAKLRDQLAILRIQAKAKKEDLEAKQCELNDYISALSRSYPLFERPVDVDEELTAGCAEVEAKHTAEAE